MWSRLKASLEKMRNAETLVVTKLDRLGRDARHVGATIRTLAARKISVIVWELGKLDLTTSYRKLMLQMAAAMAEMEHDLPVKRTQAGHARANTEGKTFGRKPKTTPQQRKEIIGLYSKQQWVSSLASMFSISRESALAIVTPSP